MLQTSEHTCDVVKIKLLPHPNADKLSLVMVGDFQCIVRTEDWKDGDLAVYVPPDNIVPETKEFEFLGGHRRIKARKLRGEWSAGLLVPAPEGAKIGDDCMERLGIIHYEPKARGDFSTDGENVKPPRSKETSKAGLFTPVYDVLNFRKYSDLFEDGEEVIVTEKLHGANSRFTCADGQIYCGSRRFWKKEDSNNLWWKALSQNKILETWLRNHQNYILYGEVLGQVQNLKYGAKNGEIFFAAFDILKGNKWLDFDEACEIGYILPWVPLVYRGPFDKYKILAFAEEDSLWPCAQHCREGVVVKPVHERTDHRIGRVQLKVVGNRYLSKS
jgi:RNA ligase (TIGR02306 family)